MKTKDSNEDARAVGYEMPKIHSLWRALEQGLFPFMMNEVRVLTPKNKQFVAVCEAVVKPETFDYAKWKGNGHEPDGDLAGRLFCHALWLRPLPETPQNSVFSVMAQRVLTPQT